jgi:hypothetical protein
MFGHSQGGSLVHKLNTLVQTNGAIANAPGPIRLDQTCSVNESNNGPNSTCTKLFGAYGTANATPLSSNQYFLRSVENYVTGHLAPITYTQALDDTKGYLPGLLGQVGWMSELMSIMQANGQVYSYYTVPTGGHDAFVDNTYLHTIIKGAVNSVNIQGAQNVMNGDEITLSTTTPSSPEQSKDVVFTVSGVDNTTLPPVPGSTSDTWTVRTKDRDCNPNTISNQTYADAPLDTTLGFTILNVGGFEDTCSVKVSTNQPNYSYVKTANGTGTSNIPLSPNGSIDVYLRTASGFNQTRGATITVKSDFRALGSTFTVSATTKSQDISPTVTFITAGPGDQIPPTFTSPSGVVWNSFDDNQVDGDWDWRDPNSIALEYRAVRPQDLGGPRQQNWSFTISNFDYANDIVFRWGIVPVNGIGGGTLGANTPGQVGWFGGDVRSGSRRTDLASTTNYFVNDWVVPTSNVATGYFTLPAPKKLNPRLPPPQVDNPPLNYDYFSSFVGLKLQAYVKNPNTGLYEYKGFVGDTISLAVRACAQFQYDERINGGIWTK